MSTPHRYEPLPAVLSRRRSTDASSTRRPLRPRPQSTHLPSRTRRRSLGVLPSERSVDVEALETAVPLRHSEPTIAPTYHESESVLMHTDVRIAGVARRDRHCVYLLEVASGDDDHHTHGLAKRFSELRAFRHALVQDMTKATTPCGGHGVCAQLAPLLAYLPFPRRRLRLHVPGLVPTNETSVVDVALERLPLLERFLQAVLRIFRLATRRRVRECVTSHCVVLDRIRRFLEVAEPKRWIHSRWRSSVAASTRDRRDDDEKVPMLEAVPMPVAFPSSPRSLAELLVTRPMVRCSTSGSLFAILEDPELVEASR